jgi:hypothetical protein
VRPKATVPFTAQLGHGWELGPVFPHATRLLQQTQAILGLELRNQVLDGVVHELVWRFPGVLRHGLKGCLFLCGQVQSCDCHSFLPPCTTVAMDGSEQAHLCAGYNVAGI